MGEQPLYDLAPLLEIMGVGAVIALAPLLWVWRRNRGAGPARYLQALGLLTLFLTFDLVLFGAFTRLTDSGLGCPDWPGCYGNASPFGATHEIAMAQAAMPSGPVTFSKAWIEMIHRYLATMVGVLIFAGLTAWDTQRLKKQYAEVAGTEFAGKVVVMGALSLYLDFINMFMYLLRFLGDRR